MNKNKTRAIMRKQMYGLFKLTGFQVNWYCECELKMKTFKIPVFLLLVDVLLLLPPAAVRLDMIEDVLDKRIVELASRLVMVLESNSGFWSAEPQYTELVSSDSFLFVFI